MKKTLQFACICLLSLASMLVVSSCETEEEELNIPTVNFTFDDYWPYVANGQQLTLEGLAIDESKSSPGLRIVQVEYLFDDKSISSSTAAPFALNYKIQGQSIGEHTLTAIIKVKGDGYVDMTYTLKFTITVLEEPFVLDFNITYDDESFNNSEIRNGETLSGTISLSENTSVDATITRVEYYWDGTMFSGTSIAPFRFEYQMNRQTIGAHEFKIVVNVDTELGEFKLTRTIPFNILR